MKKLAILLVVVLAVPMLTMGCKKDEDDDPTVDASVKTKQFQETGKKPAGLKANTIGAG